MECLAQPNTQVLTKSSDFCLMLANQVVRKEATKGSNFLASPLSLHFMLSLIATGSKGQALEQLLFFLKSTTVSDLTILSSQILSLTNPDQEGGDNYRSGALLSFVNGVWLDQSFTLKPSFEDIVKGSYKAQIEKVDFFNKANEVVKEVNSWVEKETKGLIKQLLPSGSLGSYTSLVLANALYFKGSWHQNFDASKTIPKDFHLLDGQIVQLPFMSTKQHQLLPYKCFHGFVIIKIPYPSGQDPRKFSIYIFLPNEKDGLLNLIQTVETNPSLLTEQYGMERGNLCEFSTPKFKFSFQMEASEAMKEMGLTLPFQPGALTNAVDCPNSEELYVSNIFHKSYIEVNEAGTEAAASTAVGITLFGRPIPPSTSFVADHPFMFMIREETQRVVFFTGAVLNPLLNSQ